MPNISKSDTEWKQQLTPEQYEVLRNKGTEAPFTGKYDNFKETGMYVCAGCGTTLFSSEAKFDSGCGWPSFDTVIDKKNMREEDDHSVSMHRTEVLCNACGGHLGHVFPDGPTATGLRYCINSAALDFQKKNT